MLNDELQEPGQGRQVSRPPSLVGGQFGIDPSPEEPPTQSQRSSLFPWDNAGVFSSSSGGGGLADGSDRISVDRADIRMRGSSVSRRESSLIPSASATGLGLSPSVADRGSQVGADYRFEGIHGIVSVFLRRYDGEFQLIRRRVPTPRKWNHRNQT